MKKYGKKTTYKSPSEYLKAPKKPREVRVGIIKSKKTAGYKVPKTPKSSGYKWGG